MRGKGGPTSAHSIPWYVWFISQNLPVYAIEVYMQLNEQVKRNAYGTSPRRVSNKTK